MKVRHNDRYNGYPTNKETSNTHPVFAGNEYVGSVEWISGSFVKGVGYKPACWLTEDGKSFTSKALAFDHAVKSALPELLGF